ncbi:unnamed protein product [Musa acuminata subsp. burmannicoides]
MTPILSEILLSGFTINSTLRRRTHLVQSLSVVFLYWFYLALMVPPGDTSCGWSQIGKSQPEQEQALMNQRKQKRMVSNRESARRSRMRKQKHLEDLTAELRQLRKENSQILTALSITKQHYAEMEAQNAVLRAQTMELGATLQSLNQILVLRCMHGTDWVSDAFGETSDSLARTWSMVGEKQPISTASSDMFHYC